MEQKEKFLQTAGTKPRTKNNFKQFKPFDLEKIKVEVGCTIINISAQITNLIEDSNPAGSVEAVDALPKPEERWKQCYVSFES